MATNFTHEFAEERLFEHYEFYGPAPVISIDTIIVIPAWARQLVAYWKRKGII